MSDIRVESQSTAAHPAWPQLYEPPLTGSGVVVWIAWTILRVERIAVNLFLVLGNVVYARRKRDTGAVCLFALKKTTGV